MDEKKTIIWDIDGVLSDFTYGFRQFASQFYRMRVTPTGAKKTWAFQHLANEEERDLWERIGRGEYDWSRQPSLLSPMDTEAMRVLYTQTGVDYLYVTSRIGPTAQVVAQTQAWLTDHGLPNPGNVVVSNDKVGAIKAAGIEPYALIDDDIRNIVAYRAAYGTWNVYIRDWQYNRCRAVDAVYGIGSPECNAAQYGQRVSSVAEFCYAVLEAIDGVDRG